MGLTMIELKVLRKKRIKLVATVMICICALIVATSLIIFLLARKGNVIYVEAGEGIDLCEIFGRDDVEFDFNFKTENLNHPGTYEADVIIGSKIKRLNSSEYFFSAPRNNPMLNKHASGLMPGNIPSAAKRPISKPSNIV